MTDPARLDQAVREALLLWDLHGPAGENPFCLGYYDEAEWCYLKPSLDIGFADTVTRIYRDLAPAADAPHQ